MTANDNIEPADAFISAEQSSTARQDVSSSSACADSARHDEGGTANCADADRHDEGGSDNSDGSAPHDEGGTASSVGSAPHDEGGSGNSDDCALHDGGGEGEPVPQGRLVHSDDYWRFLGTCTQCGHCTKACPSLVAADMTLGEVAKALLAAERESDTDEDLAYAIAGNPQLVQAVRGCFFCTTCKNTCFAHNDVCDLMYNARVDFQRLGLIPRFAWSSVMVDQEWDIFTAYRAIYGIYLGDLVRHVANDEHGAESDCEVAFFPGCSLAAYAPELTREIFETVQQLGGKTTMIDHCCGSPLKSAGFFDRAEALCDKIADEVAFSGAKTMVCVCPGCANAMRATLARHEMDDVRVVSLSAYLSERGFEPKHPLPDAPICISKSCQDRDGSYLRDTCAALGLDEGAPRIFHGCCGAGGAVSAFDPNRQAAQADSKLSFAEDGSTVVTMCPTCTYTYASQLMAAPRDLRNKHYAELMFENQIDWGKVFSQLQGMYEGEYGPWLSQVFA